MRIFSFLFGLLMIAAQAHAQTFEIEGKDGTICAAFAFGKGLIATAAHCTIGSAVYRLPGGGTARLKNRGVFDGAFLTENERTAQDVALLATAAPLPKAPRVIQKDATLGEIVEIHPPGFGYRECRVTAKYGDAYDLACEVEAGWSGSPIYARRRLGRPVLIGLVSGRLGEEGNGMAVMVHARALRKLLATR